LSIVCSGPISDPLLALLVRTSQSVIICAPPAAPSSSSSSSPSASTPLPDLTSFLHNLVRRCATVTPSVLLLATSYLARLERKLPPTARGLACTVHRIMLAALLIATKYLHDGPVRNRHWAANSGLFSLPEVNLMERQLLFLLEFEL
ncbi:cyclin-domain-containing protein, partial [Geranomyces variabilis]